MTDLAARTTVIRPLMGRPSDPFWEGARRGELLIQRCPSCRARWHPPSPSCPRCGRFDVGWIPSSGRGTLHSLAVVRRAAHPLVEDWTPYNIALVELEEGPRIVSSVWCDDPGSLPFGTELIVDFLPVGLELVLPVFRPRTDQNGEP